jgi:hypothetical protein
MCLFNTFFPKGIKGLIIFGADSSEYVGDPNTFSVGLEAVCD